MTSVLNVDTIADKAGTGPVGLTKQQATKHWVNYDAVNGVTDGSFNQSSLTDHTTGDFTSLFTSNFSSASDKCHFASALNSTDDGNTRVVGPNRGGIDVNIGMIFSNANATVLSTSQVDFSTAYGSDASANGAEDDLSATYCMTIGDLA